LSYLDQVSFEAWEGSVEPWGGLRDVAQVKHQFQKQPQIYNSFLDMQVAL
jgi:hypothetical protein